MTKAILTHTNNPAYKGLEGQEGYLHVDEYNNFHFTYEQNGQNYDLNSHIDGRLGELGNAYRSPEISIRTGMCDFVFDQRTPILEQEKVAPKIMLYEDYNKMSTEFFANRNNAELAAKFNDIAAKIKNDEIMLIPNAAEYVKKHLDAGNRDNIEVVGRGTIGFQDIPCSDLIAISVNPVGNDLVGVYSHGEVEIDARFGNLENAIEQNSVGNDAPDIADDILR